MEETPPTEESPVEAPKRPMMSLGARLLNVFATPSEVFEEVKLAPPAPANWLTPALLLIVTSWLGTWLVFSQDSIRHQLTELTDKAIQKQIEKTHMSKEQAEMTRKVAEIGKKAGPITAAVVI